MRVYVQVHLQLKILGIYADYQHNLKATLITLFVNISDPDKSKERSRVIVSKMFDNKQKTCRSPPAWCHVWPGRVSVVGSLFVPRVSVRDLWFSVLGKTNISKFHFDQNQADVASSLKIVN